MSITKGRGVTVSKATGGKTKITKNTAGEASRLLQVGDISHQVFNVSFDPELGENGDEKSSGK